MSLYSQDEQSDSDSDLDINEKHMLNDDKRQITFIFGSVFICFLNIWTVFSSILWFTIIGIPEGILLFLELIVELLLFFEAIARLYSAKFSKANETLSLLHARKNDPWWRYLALFVISLPQYTIMYLAKNFSDFDIEDPTITIGLPFRILRMFEITRFIETAEELLFFKYVKGFISFRLIVNFGNILLLMHTSAATWLLIQKYAARETFNVNSENKYNPYRDGLSYFARTDKVNAPVYDQYIDSLQWVVTAVCGCSFGDVTPRIFPEILASLAVMILGASFLATLFGNFASLNILLSKEKSEEKGKYSQAITFCELNKIPPNIKEKVHLYYRMDDGIISAIKFQDVWDSTPICLHTEMILLMNKDFISNCNLLQSCSGDFLITLMKILKPSVCLPGDIILRKGEVAEELYFIKDGKVEVLGTDEKTRLYTLKKGEFIGETGMLIEEKRAFTVKALKKCHFLVLRKDELDELIPTYPKEFEYFKELSSKRLEQTQLINTEKLNKEKQSPQPPMLSLLDRSSEITSIRKLLSPKNPESSVYPNQRLNSQLGLIDNTKSIRIQDSENNPEDSNNLGWRMYPMSKGYYIWASLLGAAICYNLFYIPYSLTFDYQATQGALIGFDILVVLIYILDIYLQLRTPLITLNGFNINKEAIFRNYYKTYMVVDIISAIPIDYVFLALAVPDTYNEWIRVLRFLKLKKYMTMIGDIIEDLGTKGSLLKVQILVIIFILMNHYAACGMFAVCKAIEINDITSQGLNFFRKYDQTSILNTPMIAQEPWMQYVNFLYWSYQASSSGATGDVIAVTPTEKLFQIFVMLSFRVYLAFLSAEISNVVSGYRATYSVNAEKTQLYVEWMKHIKLSEEKQLRVKKYYEHKWNKFKGLDKEQILRDLPSTIKIEILEHMLKGQEIDYISLEKVLEQFELLQKTDKQSLSVLLKKFTFKVITDGEYILKKGEIIEVLYFIIEGEAAVLDADEETILLRISKNNIFGEFGVYEGIIRTVSKSVKALTPISLALLPIQEFQELSKHLMMNSPRVKNHTKARNESNAANYPFTNQNNDQITNRIINDDSLSIDTEKNLNFQSNLSGRSNTRNQLIKPKIFKMESIPEKNLQSIEMKKMKKKLPPIKTELINAKKGLPNNILLIENVHQPNDSIIGILKNYSPKEIDASMHKDFDASMHNDSVIKKLNDKLDFDPNNEKTRTDITANISKNKLDEDQIRISKMNNNVLDQSHIINYRCENEYGKEAERDVEVEEEGFDADADGDRHPIEHNSSDRPNTYRIHDLSHIDKQIRGTKTKIKTVNTITDKSWKNLLNDIYTDSKEILLTLVALYNYIFIPLKISFASLSYNIPLFIIESISLLILLHELIINIILYVGSHRSRLRNRSNTTIINQLFVKNSIYPVDDDNKPMSSPRESQIKFNKKKSPSIFMLLKDIIVIIPFALIFDLSIDPHERIHSISYSLLQLNRLLMGEKLYFIMKIKFLKKNYAIADLVGILYTFLILNHIGACGWIITANLSNEDMNYTWLSKVPPPYFDWPTIRPSHNIEDYASPNVIYLTALYWSYFNSSHIGGDINAINMAEKIYTAIYILIALMFFVVLFGDLVSLIDNMRPKFQIIFEKNYYAVLQYLKSNNITSYTEKARNYYDYLWSSSKGINERDILDDLPNNLRFEIQAEYYNNSIKMCSFFKDKNSMLNYNIINYYFQKCEYMIYMPEETIISAGSVSDKIYLILEGQVEKRLKRKNNFEYHFKLSMHPGAVFGGIIPIWKQSHDIVAISQSNNIRKLSKLAVLNAENYKVLCEAYPEWATRKKFNVKEFRLLTTYLRKWKIAKLRTTLGQEKTLQNSMLPRNLIRKKGISKAQIKMMTDKLADKISEKYTVLKNDRHALSTPLAGSLFNISELLNNTNTKKRVNKPHKKYYFLPDSKAKLATEILHLLLIVYTGIALPVIIGFKLKLNAFTMIMEIICLIESIFYFISQFFTARYINAGLTLQYQALSKYFMSHGLILEVIGMIPFNLIFFSVEGSSPSEISVIDLTRMLRVLLLFRMIDILNTVMANYPRLINLINVCKPWLLFLFVSHISSCLWLWVNMIEKRFDYSLYWYEFLEMNNRPMGQVYIFSVFFVMNIVTTTGFPEMILANMDERAWFIFYVYIGDALFTLAFGLIVASSKALPEKYENVYDTISKIDTIAIENGILDRFHGKLKEFYAFLVYRGNNSNFLKELDGLLPLNMIKNIAIDKLSYIHKCPLFDDATTLNFLEELVTSLEQKVYLSEDYLTQKHDQDQRMFFIHEGSVNILSKNQEDKGKVLTNHMYCGLLSIFIPTIRKNSVVSIGSSVVLVLTKKALDFLMEKFPASELKIRKNAYRMVISFGIPKSIAQIIVQSGNIDHLTNSEITELDNSLPKIKLINIDKPLDNNRSIIQVDQPKDTPSKSKKFFQNMTKSSLKTKFSLINHNMEENNPMLTGDDIPPNNTRSYFENKDKETEEQKKMNKFIKKSKLIKNVILTMNTNTSKQKQLSRSSGVKIKWGINLL